MVEGLRSGRTPYLDVEVPISIIIMWIWHSHSGSSPNYFLSFYSGVPLLIIFWALLFSRLTTQVPKTYREVYREIMTADPLVVDLHKQGPYYYEFGRSVTWNHANPLLALVSAMLITFIALQTTDQAVSVWGRSHWQEPHKHLQDQVQEDHGLLPGD